MQLAATQGIWAVLFVFLFIWVIRENMKRECAYQVIIKDLTERLGVLDEIKKDITDIKDCIKK